MTRTISFIIGIAVAALVAVPTALGAYPLGDSPSTSKQQDAVTFFYANERSTLAQQPVQLRRTDAWDRTATPPATLSSTYKDAGERVNLNELPSTPVVEPVASSGTDVDWPQVGIGFGIGIALAIVLGLSFRATRQRPLAH
jgi:hypothetical protein